MLLVCRLLFGQSGAGVSGLESLGLRVQDLKPYLDPKSLPGLGVP